MSDLSYEKAIQQLRELDASVRLVIAHPAYISQHRLLNEFLQEHGVIYIRFSGANLTQSQLKQQLDRAIILQTDHNLATDSRILLFDECDRADAAAFDAFLPQIVSDASTQRVIIISRLVPKCLFIDEDLRASTRFVPTDPELLLWDYTQRDRETALLEVRSFGTGQVLLNGRIVDNWDGLLPRSLFFYLVDKGMTTRNDIFATFWPDLSVREATNVFHVTKRKVSEVLGVDLTTYWSGFYRISPSIQLSYDAVQFSELVQNSQVRESADAVDLLNRAIALYRGNFLTSLSSEWVTKRRQELLQLYIDALSGLAQMMQRSDKIQKALGLYLRAFAINRQREDLAENIMHIYNSLGMYADGLRVYDLLETELSKSLNITPTVDLRQLAATLRMRLDSQS